MYSVCSYWLLLFYWSEVDKLDTKQQKPCQIKYTVFRKKDYQLQNKTQIHIEQF